MNDKRDDDKSRPRKSECRANLSQTTQRMTWSFTSPGASQSGRHGTVRPYARACLHSRPRFDISRNTSAVLSLPTAFAAW